jgi:hypothetical protein
LWAKVKPAKAAAHRRDIGILGQCASCWKKPEDDAAGIEEGDRLLTTPEDSLPAERRIEGTAAGQVADAKGDEADRLSHAKHLNGEADRQSIPAALGRNMGFPDRLRPLP